MGLELNYYHEAVAAVADTLASAKRNGSEDSHYSVMDEIETITESWLQKDEEAEALRWLLEVVRETLDHF